MQYTYTYTHCLKGLMESILGRNNLKWAMHCKSLA